MVLHELCADSEVVTSEELTLQIFSYEIGQERFSWRYYSEYPDKKRVENELWRLQQADPALAEGHVNVGAKLDRKDGWTITPAGVRLAKSLRKKYTLKDLDAVGKSSQYERDRFIKDISSSQLYKSYTDDGIKDVDIIQITDFLNCLPDAKAHVIRQRLDNKIKTSMNYSTEDITDFLIKLKDKTVELLGAE